MSHIVVIGASGNLGVRLVGLGLQRGLRIRAFVRDPDRLARRLENSRIDRSMLTVVKGDAMDRHRLEQAMTGCDAAVNAAGHVADGRRFTSIFRNVLEAGKATFGTTRRLWFLGGIATLTVPHTRRVPARMLGMPWPYRRHHLHWQLLKASGANWSMACPGPMIAAPGDQARHDLLVSAELLPYPMGRWTVIAPPFVIPLYMMGMLPKVTVTYEDVASVILDHLAPDSDFKGQRVGFSLPPGVWQWKRGWMPGMRGPET